ncbi:uncharacterized protein LOC115333138 [Ixodes scapularis]|uniref:uncharacterized protein LOC115333138 n=1 Tax=Ixodes scapularis TaxID=6945 RepID=UPI001161B198|nr:uncharacterized protein LOC115333138 [Ixodes scapularis]
MQNNQQWNETGGQRWNRGGEEHLQFEEEEALLSGWHELIIWLIDFLLAEPRDATFLRKFQGGLDMIESLDLYLQHEPHLFLVSLICVVYAVLGFMGSVAYVLARRSDYCGGDLTQDLNQNMRCILQVYTLVFIMVLAAIL